MEFLLENQRGPDGVPPIDFRAQLNDEQFAAVTAPPGPLLVLAGAGSGKTRTLTYRVAWLLSQGVRPSEILLRIHGEAVNLSRNFTILDADESEGLLRDAVEGIDKGFFKDKTHPRPGPLHSMISLARNTRMPLPETIARYFPQHEGLE